MQSTDQWPELMTLPQAIAFVAAHGVKVSPAVLRYSPRWPKPQKLANGVNIRWRKEDLMTKIQQEVE